MEKIQDNGKLLAIVWRSDDWKSGLNFPTPDDWFIQIGCWQYSNGKRLVDHRHKHYERIVSQTQEMVFVKQGRMRVFVYNSNKSLVGSFILEDGDMAILGDCGHGYEILQDDTQVLEAKTGPFIDVDTDKEPLFKQ